LGYADDTTLADKLGKNAVAAPDAVAYHNNPETLSEVYLSARWIARSPRFNKTFIQFARYTPVNSLRIALEKIVKGAPVAFLLFKLVYDAGMMSGIFFSSGNVNK
jgi:hypothetical protein